MRIQAKTNGSAIAVLDLDGRLTAGLGVARLREKVNTLLDEGFNNVVLNMRCVDLVDCAGIGLLANCYSKTRKKGGSLKLVEADHRLRHLLEVFGLESHLEVCESERRAVENLVVTPSRAPARHPAPVRPRADRCAALMPMVQAQRAT